MTNPIDPTLARDGDSRNVVDAYKTWTIDAIKQDLSAKAFPVHIAIENYQHDYNIGSIVRNANAFNVSGVHIIGKRHWNRRGAMATEKYLTLYHHTTIEDFIAWAADNTLPIVGIDNTPGSKPLHTTSLPKACVLTFGQEGPGLSPELQSHCNTIIAIEQFGSTRSINVGVASGIIMYAYAQTWAFI
jgi:tRNA G18 (ribose-2'-O)-methylase SpoU